MAGIRRLDKLKLQWVHGRITVVTQLGLSADPMAVRASMGPRSDNRGYGTNSSTARVTPALQWVHGRITVVTHKGTLAGKLERVASMGPRSDNRGYEPKETPEEPKEEPLQWVHGR